MIPKDINILIAEDSYMLRQLLVNDLTNNGYSNISESNDGLNAFVKINDSFNKNQPVQFLITDNYMPNITGVDLIVRLRELNQFKRLPIILQTSEIKIQEIKKVSIYGCFDYIKKPIHTELLIYKMENLWKFITEGKWL